MKILVVFALIACAVAFELPRAHKVAPRSWKIQPRFADEDKIVGGTVAGRSEFPFIISLRKKQTDWWSGKVTEGHICGGTIIASNRVLTAAHCTTGSAGSDFSIAAGQFNKNSDTDDGTEQIRSVSDAVEHSSYSSSTLDNDFSVLKLSSGLSLGGSVSSITLDSVSVGQNVVVAGWGATSEGGSGSAQLLKLTVPVLSKSDCLTAYSGITDNMVCAGYLNLSGKDSCQGDSGGPLTIGTGKSARLVGVVSWGQGCARLGFPGVYARVSTVQSWINSI